MVLRQRRIANLVRHYTGSFMHAEKGHTRTHTDPFQSKWWVFFLPKTSMDYYPWWFDSLRTWTLQIKTPMKYTYYLGVDFNHLRVFHIYEWSKQAKKVEGIFAGANQICEIFSFDFTEIWTSYHIPNELEISICKIMLFGKTYIHIKCIISEYASLDQLFHMTGCPSESAWMPLNVYMFSSTASFISWFYYM